MTHSPRMMMLFALIAGFSIVIIGSALYSEYGLNMAPCGLCLRQRIGHYIAIPLALVVVLSNWRPSGGGKWPNVILAVAVLGALAFSLYTAGFHIGVEMKWWKGLESCGGTDTTGLTLQEILDTQFVPCDRPTVIFQWFFGGLSMATVHFLLLLPLVGLSAYAVHQAWTMPRKFA